MNDSAHDSMNDSAANSLDHAAHWWARRGYTVRYRDAHLVQLIRRGRPGSASAGWLLSALCIAGLAVVLLVLGLRRRPFHVVSLTITPDKRVITHRIWAQRPPDM